MAWCVPSIGGLQARVRADDLHVEIVMQMALRTWVRGRACWRTRRLSNVGNHAAGGHAAATPVISLFGDAAVTRSGNASIKGLE